MNKKRAVPQVAQASSSPAGSITSNIPETAPPPRHALAKVTTFLRRESIAGPLLLLVLLTAALVSPRGDFPLNDDWVYTKSVQALLEKGSFAGHPFAAAITVAQMYWGALFCKLFGFSFTTLRLSTLVLSYAGAWAAARAALTLGLTRWPAFLCGALVFSSPLILNLSYTFMSDVPFMAFTALCGMFYMRALHTPSAAALAWGSVFGVLACLSRQFGVFMPIAFGATVALFLLQRRYALTPRMLAAFFGVWALGVVVFLYFHFTRTPGLSIPPPEPAHSAFARVLNTFHYGAMALTYIGLFLLPFAPGAALTILKADGRWRSGRLAAAAGLFVVLFALLWTDGIRRLPELGIGNMLYDLGVGPMTMSDAYFGLHNWMPARLGQIWWVFTIGAVFTAGLIVLHAWDTVLASLYPALTREVENRRVRINLFLLLWASAMLACPWNPWLPRIFDRYFVGAIVPFLLFLGSEALRAPKPVSLRWAFASGIAIYFFSVAGLHDYFAWNHARWAVIAQLQDEQNVPSNQIDGGFEFNGMYTSDEFMALHHTQNFFDSTSGKGGYWILDNEYVIGISAPREGYDIVLSAPYTSWLGLHRHEVHAFRRTHPAGA